MRILKHVGIILLGTLILLGVPLWMTGYLNVLFSGNPDAISSASVILDKPSGEYIVLINNNMRKDDEKISEWETFFTGGDILYIFEDIACTVANSDAGGIELADSFRSKLPENQMKVMQEDATLMLSRADEGLFDIIIMSEEFAEAYKAETAYSDSVTVVKVSVEETEATAETETTEENNTSED